ncbi:putative toxin-antitoxin system toxin component, PIN family [Corticibacter populi]|uniref:Putative toxin-antitoxin system toxin component, PIN family n=1 Tax=Corticibacter populi TaxID=1550736 RepID=A0A3M6QNX8_9BURK|nr:putative toxin-antitoxin system toxin component, PIN family [Corticibacter populi]RMX04758.1 putative toxin-antitoxin system toxin component, PIN family [Corticibacter populi]RZS33837.1 putative PIN family toxin of toxin-antitoxin system [Corticibacter populi]
MTDATLTVPPAAPGVSSGPTALILDTNIVLDLLLFGDPAAMALQAQLQAVLAQPAQWRWIATQPMREELRHVLAYAHLQPRLAYYRREPAQILAHFDAGVELVEIAAATVFRCKDGDDQKFIDLAVAHQAVLLSKDKAVLRLRKRLARVGVQVDTQLPLPAAASGGAFWF